MKSLKRVLLYCAFATAPAAVHAGSLVLPSDVSVALSADPAFRLEPLEPINFTLTVTNNGPNPVPLLVVNSAAIYDDQFTVYDGTSDCGLITSVADGPTSYWYYREWYLASEVLGYPPLDPGEVRTCHFTESLWYSAGRETSYSFGIPETWSDPDPSNNIATVDLFRAVPTVPIPAASGFSLAALAAFLAAMASRFVRSQAGQVHRRS